MADKGIIFSAPMVRALLAGTKTQTRRMFKLPTKTHSGGPIYERPDMGGWAVTTHGGEDCFTIGRDGERRAVPECAGLWHQTTGTCVAAPYLVGDRLYVRENWQALSFGEYLPTKYHPSDVRYAATDPLADADKDVRGFPWRPCIHMPRWASRITLAVTEVRVQRLQDISEVDAIAEGIERIDDPRGTAWKSYETCPDGKPHPHASAPNRSPITSYRELWNSLHTKPGETWDDNPWIVAVSFEVSPHNIDRSPA